MATQDPNVVESPPVTPFQGAFDPPHRRVDPCFMTGKGCVYTDAIERTLRDRRTERRYLGFSIMPFRDNVRVFFRNCLSPFFESNYCGRVVLQRADEVRRPGIIICEGICKRIQESDFITADISLPNANVFYELGLAYGIGHKIVVLYHSGSAFGELMARSLADIDCPAQAYVDLNPILAGRLDSSEHVWQQNLGEPVPDTACPSILFLEQHLVGDGTGSEHVAAEDRGISEDIALTFETHMKSAVGLAIAKIAEELRRTTRFPTVSSYIDTIESFRRVISAKSDASLKEIKEQVDRSYCLMVRTGFKSCHPMAYFWLGYSHARGKNVIPVTAIDRRNDRVDDLAFDIRAQRHMVFIRQAADRFEHELTSSLKQMIIPDFSEWSRKRFWDRMLGKRGEVSIFTGALHVDAIGREMVGDWDLRAASELASYLAQQQYRAKIEDPVYTPEYPGRDRDSTIVDYKTSLRQLVAHKNCIVVASPDVNPLTELVFGAMYRVPEGAIFPESPESVRSIEPHPKAMVVVKEISGSVNDRPDRRRFFYKEVPVEGETTGRGFESNELLRDRRAMFGFVSQVSSKREGFTVLGHVVILPNLFCTEDCPHQCHMIVLNGVSGPATFALTHVLTGGVSEEFVSYEEQFGPESESESILRLVLSKLSHRPFRYLDFIVDVTVGRSRSQHRPHGVYTSDWRRILGWKLNDSAREHPVNLVDAE